MRKLTASRRRQTVSLLSALLVVAFTSRAPGPMPQRSSASPFAMSVAQAGSDEPAFAATLRPLIEARMAALRVPGAIVYVEVPDQGRWLTAFGTADLATGAPLGVDHHMRIGSITKTLVGTVILQLADEGRLGLDEPIARYLPGAPASRQSVVQLPRANALPPVPNGENITIRQLLNLTSGLYDYAVDREVNQIMDTEPDRVWQPADLVAAGVRHPPYFAPGQEWHYSNTNTILLGMLIEHLTGQPLEAEVQRRIFDPLGMRNSLMPARTSAAVPSPHPRGLMSGHIF